MNSTQLYLSASGSPCRVLSQGTMSDLCFKGIMMAVQGGIRLKFKHGIHSHVKEDA